LNGLVGVIGTDFYRTRADLDLRNETVFSAMCRADTITLDLMPPLLSGSQGSIISFSGVLSNTSAASVFLNSAGINLSGGFAATDLDTGPFFANAPLFLIAGDLTPTIDFFSISIPSTFAGGTYQGTFTVLGGADESALDVVGSADFTLEVSAVPEPNSAVLLSLGVLIVIVRSAVSRRMANQH
jgi:hypothetical protein